MKEIAVQCEGLVKTFEDAGALSGLDLLVLKGEIMALIGPSGCGKTTLLRLITGVTEPDSGSIVIGGKPVVGPSGLVPPEKRRVGMVFQNYALFPHLSVAANVAYGLKGHDQHEKVRAMLQLVNLVDHAYRMPHELSGGEQQRVALARALGPQPDVLLLDEPFSNLDAGQRVQVRNEVRAILRMSGTTAIFVTHHQEEALFMGDRVAVQNQGRIEQTGTPDEVFGNPATRFVAEFMGETDFIPGEVTQEGVQTEIGMLQPGNEVSIGAQVDVAVRADDVNISPDPSSGAIVLAREFRGMVNVYRVRLPSGRFIHSMQRHTVHIAPATHVRVIMEPGHGLTCFSGSQS
jgi:iron(III) transport system ATP-binding protein